MSESPGFPHTGGYEAVFDSTIRSVEACQLFVLVIGRRYGSLHPETGLSITEMEYNAARDNGLPTVVFVEEDVKTGWDRWRAKVIPKREIPHWVDDVRVWEFLTRVMAEDACPVFPYADVGGVLENMHGQLANFFGALLRFDRGARVWLWTAERTGSFERHASSVWVVSPDLYWDFQDEQYRELVYENVVGREVAYRYLYSNTPQNADRVEELRANYKDALGNDQAAATVRFAPIPEDSFWWCTEHVLFNAFTNAEEGLIVDICEDRDRSRKYDVLMGRSKKTLFRRQFTQLWSIYSTEPLGGEVTP
jgi:hypothetical protein